MNFLAHAYLSGTDENIIVGNFIADHVKGKAIERYAEEIKAGIRLHRWIDTFTDNHAIVRESIVRLRKDFGKYSGVIVDMYYDHFLAKHWNNYSPHPLKSFTSQIYQVMMKHFFLLPPKTRRILPYMMADDWLAGYARLEGLQMALAGMSRRTRFNSNMEHAVEALLRNYDLFYEDFRAFFEILVENTEKYLNNSLNKEISS